MGVLGSPGWLIKTTSQEQQTMHCPARLLHWPVPCSEAFCCGGKDPQTLAKRNYQETPNTLLLGMVIKNYKLWATTASGYSSSRLADSCFGYEDSTPASCLRLLCWTQVPFSPLICSCFFWPHRPKWESQGTDSLSSLCFYLKHVI